MKAESGSDPDILNLKQNTLIWKLRILYFEYSNFFIG